MDLLEFLVVFTGFALIVGIGAKVTYEIAQHVNKWKVCLPFAFLVAVLALGWVQVMMVSI